MAGVVCLYFGLLMLVSTEGAILEGRKRKALRYGASVHDLVRGNDEPSWLIHTGCISESYHAQSVAVRVFVLGNCCRYPSLSRNALSERNRKIMQFMAILMKNLRTRC